VKIKGTNDIAPLFGEQQMMQREKDSQKMLEEAF
jgi:hypothetical protein